MILLWIFLFAFLFLTALPLALIVCELWRVTIRGGVPSISSTWAIVDKVIAERVLPAQGMILDLGCGRASVLRGFLRSGMRGPFLGYEKAFAPWAMGAFWNWITRSPVKVIRGDYLQAPIEQARGIYLFLLPDALAQLGPELARRAKPGTIIVSAEFSIPEWEPEKIFEARGVTKRRAKIFVHTARQVPAFRVR